MAQKTKITVGYAFHAPEHSIPIVQKQIDSGWMLQSYVAQTSSHTDAIAARPIEQPKLGTSARYHLDRITLEALLMLYPNPKLLKTGYSCTSNTRPLLPTLHLKMQYTDHLNDAGIFKPQV